MRFRSAAFAASLLIAGSVSALAQTTTVKITAPSIPGATAVTSGSATAGSYPAGTPNFYVSPYAGLINYNTATGTGTSVALNCVDYFHDVYIGDVWTANVTNLGTATNAQLLNTRYGSLNSGSLGTILQLYKQAAWLTLQIDRPNPGATGSADETRAIQSAIWSLFNNYDGQAALAPSYDDPTTVGNSSSWWAAQSALAENQLSAADLQSFMILSDAAGAKQEFIIHTTPEPGTVVLMLTGIIALLVVMRRRRGGAVVVESA